MKQVLMMFVMIASQRAMAAQSAFSDVTTQQPVCYGREYSLSHMKSAPKQTVQKIQAKLEIPAPYPDSNFLFVEVTLKGARNAYTNYRAGFSCFDGVCAIDCDGGQVEISKNDDGTLSLKNKGFILKGGCGEKGKTVFLKAIAGGDDEFVLTKLPSEMCQSTTEYKN